jgi:hypothetical protein
MDWELVNPEGAARDVAIGPAARPGSLDGKIVGLAWNGKPGGDAALNEIARLLEQEVPSIRFVRYWETVPESVAPRELSREVIALMAAAKPDAVIVSQAD